MQVLTLELPKSTISRLVPPKIEQISTLVQATARQILTVEQSKFTSLQHYLQPISRQHVVEQKAASSATAFLNVQLKYAVSAFGSFCVLQCQPLLKKRLQVDVEILLQDNDAPTQKNQNTHLHGPPQFDFFSICVLRVFSFSLVFVCFS